MELPKRRSGTVEPGGRASRAVEDTEAIAACGDGEAVGRSASRLGVVAAAAVAGAFADLTIVAGDTLARATVGAGATEEAAATGASGGHTALNALGGGACAAPDT